MSRPTRGSRATRRAAGAKAAPARPRGGPRRGWFVYLLRCGDGSLYAGATNDLGRRLAAHASGRGARYTRSRPPVAVVHSERAADRGAALRREAALKKLTRAEKLALVARSRSRSRSGSRSRSRSGSRSTPR